MKHFTVSNALKKGRVTHSLSAKSQYFSCNINGCKKGYRTVAHLAAMDIHDDENNMSAFMIEHVEGDELRMLNDDVPFCVHHITDDTRTEPFFASCLILYIHAPVHTYGDTYYSTTTTSDVVVVYNTSGPWILMLSGHANY